VSTDEFGNWIAVKVKTNAKGIAEVKLKITDHMGGDNYYVLVSLYPLSIDRLYKGGVDYRSLELGVARTGCLTAWKRLILHNYGMKDANGKAHFLK